MSRNDTIKLILQRSLEWLPLLRVLPKGQTAELEAYLPTPKDAEKFLATYNWQALKRDTVVISNEGLWFHDQDTWRRIGFGEMEWCDCPRDKSQLEGSLTIALKDGSDVRIPIVGSRGQFRAVYAFASMLMKILSLRDFRDNDARD